MTNIKLCYPGYTRKALTFSMDDGRVEHDEKLLSILRPVGIKGTFNLPRADSLTPGEYRSLYRGYEIANHCKYHPYSFSDGVEYKISEDPFDSESADVEYIYRHPERKNFYYFKRSVGWRIMTPPDTYIECIKACHSELEAVFGEGSVRSYVWPFGEQNSSKIKEYLSRCGYYAVRQSGLTLDTTGFAIPENTMGWRCNANHTNLGDMMAVYEAYPDDGRLKMFAFGVHASDFEKTGKWSELSELAGRYGNRPSDYWYATVGEIFDYKRACEALVVTQSTLSNTSKLTLYLELCGERVALEPGEHVSL